MGSRSHSIPSARTNATSSARFRAPSASRIPTSSGKCRSPLPSPWVSDAAQNPPLRPLAPQPTRSASRITTRRDGSVSSSRIAVHSPVNPPPTIATSAASTPRAGARAGPGSPVVNQKLPPAGAPGAAAGMAGTVVMIVEMYADPVGSAALDCVICTNRPPNGTIFVLTPLEALWHDRGHRSTARNACPGRRTGLAGAPSSRADSRRPPGRAPGVRSLEA